MYNALRGLGVALGFLVAGHAHAGWSIDFTEANIFPTAPHSIQVNKLRIDSEVVNPFDPTRPQIVSSYFDVPFVFDLASLHFVPDLNRATVGGQTCAAVNVSITNAFNGQPLPGATVMVSGQSAVTDAGGIARLTGLNGGTLNVEASAAGFRPNAPRSVDVACGTPQDVSIALSPTEGDGALQANGLRVILNWGATPEDLDSHLTGPQPGATASTGNALDRFHVYWDNPASSDGVATLDVDDTNSYGPETVTLVPPSGQNVLRPGLYRYSVHHYEGGSGMAQGNVNVELIIGGNSRTFQPPAGGTGQGDVWTVFELNVDTNGTVSVLPVNQYGTVSSYGHDVRSGARVPPRHEDAALYLNTK